MNNGFIESIVYRDETCDVYDLNYLVSNEIKVKQWLYNYHCKILVKVKDKLYKTNKVNSLDFLYKDKGNISRCCYILIFYDVNKIYIGSSIDVMRRTAEHYRQLCNRTHMNKNMIQAFFGNNQRFSVLQLIMEDFNEDREVLEQTLIDHFIQIDRDRVLNIWTLVKGYYHTDEYKTNMSRMLKEHYSIPENRERITKQTLKWRQDNPSFYSEMMKSKWADPAFREKMNEIYSSEEHKLQSSKGGSTLWNKLNSDERAKKIFLKNRRIGREANLHKWKNSIRSYMESDKFQEDVEKRRSAIQTDEYRQRASIKSKEVHANNPNLAKTQAEKLREYYSDPINKQIRREKNSNQFVPVVCDGVEYPGLAIACEKLGLTKNALRGRLTSKSPIYSNWHYVNK